MSLYRNIVWFTKGLREYTKSGYAKAAATFNSEDLNVDLKNRAIMITGSNSGIGKAAALELAKRGATIYMVCRSKERGEAAQEEIKEASKNQNVFLYVVDLAQPRDVQNFAKEFIGSQKPLHILVNNAGCMINARETVEGDLEKNFATNTLSTHILTKSLIPVIEKAEKPRIITVSSGGMLVQKLNSNDLNSERLTNFDGTMVYAQNKRQQVVLTEIYARNHPNIFFASMHPGWSDTPAVQTSMPSFRERLLNNLRTPEEGADTIVWLCCYQNLESLENGAFFQDRKVVAKHLPLAHTRSSISEETEFIQKMDELYEKYKN